MHALLDYYSDLWSQGNLKMNSLQDTPVFLPVKSPTVPFRLVSSELLSPSASSGGGAGVTVCVLCGPSPSLVEIETELLRNWKTTFSLVASLQSLHPRGFPAQANFDHVSSACNAWRVEQRRSEFISSMICYELVFSQAETMARASHKDTFF